MWCIHELSIIDGLGDERVRSYLSFERFQANLWFVAVKLRNTETGKIVHMSRNGDDIFFDTLTSYKPYGYFDVHLKRAPDKPGVTLLEIDEASLQFLSTVSDVSYVDVKPTDERALAVGQSYVVSDRFLTRFSPLDKECTCFMCGAGGLLTERACTLYHAIAFCKTGWLGDSFYMLNQSYHTSSGSVDFRRLFKVDFEDVSKARTMISRLVVSGQNPLVKMLYSL